MGNKNFIYYIAGGCVFLIIVVLIVLGCSNKNKNKTTKSDTLVFWDLEDNSKALAPIFQDFQNQNNIKIDYKVKDKTDYANVSTEAMSGGKGPDIWTIPNDFLPKYKDQIAAMPTGKLADSKAKKDDLAVYKEAYPAAVSQESIINNRIYGVPLYMDPLVLFFNRKIFEDTIYNYEQAHLRQNTQAEQNIFSSGPATWDDFVFASKLITQKSGSNVTLSGAAFGTADNVNSATDILTLLMLQDGAKMTSDDNSSAQFQTKQNVFSGSDFPGTNALSFYAGFANPANDNYGWNSSLENSVRAFAEGKTAMMVDYESQTAEIQRINANLSFSKTAVPQVKETKNPINLIKYYNYTVPKSSQNQDLAWKFILFITNKENAATFNGIAEKKLVLSQTDFPTKSWYNPDPQKVPPIFRDMISQVNAGKNPQTAIENAASQVTTLLGQLK